MSEERMAKASELAESVIGMIGIDAPGYEEGDYINPDDGLLYCGKCGTRKQMVLTMPEAFGGGERIVPKMCECAREAYNLRELERERQAAQREIESLKRSSLMDAMFEHSTFAEAIETEHNHKPIAIARKYVDRFPEMMEKNRGLLFYGPPGTGKTYIAACIANAIMEQQRTVMMTSFVKLNALAFSRNEDDEMTIARMNSAKLLIIDDLGAERGSDFSLERVYNVIDSRVRANKPMILTTNLSLAQMKETTDVRYWRIYDRVFQVCYPVEVSGPSFRRREARDMYKEMTDLFGV